MVSSEPSSSCPLVNFFDSPVTQWLVKIRVDKASRCAIDSILEGRDSDGEVLSGACRLYVCQKKQGGHIECVLFVFRFHSFIDRTDVHLEADNFGA